MNSSARTMLIRTRRPFRSPAGVVWPLLCNSKMDRSNSLLFRLGVPQPLECRLPAGDGVGAERECVSDQGTVHQRILEWVPERALAFRMETNDLPSAKGIEAIEDRFEIEPIRSGVAVYRQTRVQVAADYPWLKRLELRLGLKQVHRYVFRNWQRLARVARTERN